MLILDSVEPERWYSVRDVVKILGWKQDTIRRWIRDGLLQAFIKPGRSGRRPRVYRSVRIQGNEIIRFVKAHLTVLQPNRSLRTRIG